MNACISSHWWNVTYFAEKTVMIKYFMCPTKLYHLWEKSEVTAPFCIQLFYQKICNLITSWIAAVKNKEQNGRTYKLPLEIVNKGIMSVTVVISKASVPIFITH